MDTVAEVFLTAYQALVTNAGMKDGETVLIHAVCLSFKFILVGDNFWCIQGASGVGLAAIQLAKVLFKDTKVIVTAGK